MWEIALKHLVRSRQSFDKGPVISPNCSSLRSFVLSKLLSPPARRVLSSYWSHNVASKKSSEFDCGQGQTPSQSESTDEKRMYVRGGTRRFGGFIGFNRCCGSRLSTTDVLLSSGLKAQPARLQVACPHSPPQPRPLAGWEGERGGGAKPFERVERLGISRLLFGTRALVPHKTLFWKFFRLNRPREAFGVFVRPQSLPPSPALFLSLTDNDQSDPSSSSPTSSFK